MPRRADLLKLVGTCVVLGLIAATGQGVAGSGTDPRRGPGHPAWLDEMVIRTEPALGRALDPDGPPSFTVWARRMAPLPRTAHRFVAAHDDTNVAISFTAEVAVFDSKRIGGLEVQARVDGDPVLPNRFVLATGPF